MTSLLRSVSVIALSTLVLPFAASAQPTYEETFNGGSLRAGWAAWDNHALHHPYEEENHAAFAMTGSQLSISFPGGADHNMYGVMHAQATRPFLGSGTYEIKMDSALTGSQEFGLIFQSADHRTFLIFMLLSYIDDQTKAYVERFSYVHEEQNKKTFNAGGIGQYIPSPGPYYLRVTVDDHPLPEHRTWRFEWSTNGSTWMELIAGSFEGADPSQNIGEIQHVGVFAGNAPRVLEVWPPEFDGFDARFDYFRYYPPGAAPLPAPSDVVARAANGRVDLWWKPLAGADGYAVYGSTTAGGPYTLLGTSLEPSFSHVGAVNGTPHYYVVKAYEAGSEGQPSPDVVAVPHDQGALATLPTDGLALVLSASELAYTLNDGDPVTVWPTALGGAAVALGKDGPPPTFVSSGVNGQPAVRFDGVNDYLTVSGTFRDFSQGASIYVVAKPAALTSGFKYVLLGNGQSADGIGLGGDGAGTGVQYFAFNDWGGVGWFATPASLIAGESSLVSLVQDAGAAGSSSYAEIAKNGVPLHGASVYIPPVVSRSENYIAKSYWNDPPFNGDIAEIIVYNRKLTSTESAAVHAYLAVKYNLPMEGNPNAIPPPTSLTAVPANNSVALTWQPVIGVSGYRVYRAGPSQLTTQIAYVTGTAYTDNGVVNGVTYHYTVTAYDGGNESAYSIPVAVTPAQPQIPPPAAPSNVVSRAGENRVDLWWDAVPDAEYYVIYGASSPGGPYTELGTTTAPSFSQLEVENGTHNYYVVKAFKNGVESSFSVEVEAVPHTPGAFATLPTDGLALLLTASELADTHDDGEPVTAWASALGGVSAAFASSSSSPTFVSAGVNGKPSVRFDGVDDFFRVSGAFQDFTQGLSAYIVAKPTAVTPGYKYLLLGNGHAADGIGIGSDVSNPGVQYFAFNASGGVGWFATSSGLIPGDSSLISVIQDGGAPGSSTYAEIAKNGIPLQGANVDIPTVAARAENYIAKSYWGDAPFRGDIAEIIVYNRKLGEAEQAAVREYIALKYTLAIDGHPGTPQPLEVPGSLSAVGGDNSVSLSWSSVYGATGYRVYRTGPSEPETRIASVTSTSYTDNTVANGFEYTYTVTAFDAHSESEHSAAVSATPTPPAPLPGTIPAERLVLALDAATALKDFGAGQPITVWRDSSANGRHALSAGFSPVAVADALNGRPVVRFDGIDDYLTLMPGFDDFSAGSTLYIVVRPASPLRSAKLLVFGNGKDVDNIGFHFWSSGPLLYFVGSGFGVTWFETGPALAGNEATLLSVMQQGAVAGFGYAEAARNGAPLAGQTLYSPPVLERSQNFIGYSHWGEATFQGDIAEILLYNRTLTSTEQAAVRQYLSEKYGIAVQ